MSEELARKQKGTAVERWEILRRAILQAGGTSNTTHRCQKTGSAATVSASVRSFSTFEIFEMTPLNYDDKDSHSCKWIRYSYKDGARDGSLDQSSRSAVGLEVSAEIRQLPPTTSLEALMGFNNTGNICVWPSEEILALYCLTNRKQFIGKSVCEIGGGMTALAGVMLSLTNLPAKVELTDGNVASVENISCIVEKNRTSFGSVCVQAKHLLWDEDFLASHYPRFDFVICADCLFFTELHSCLARVIHKLLTKDGKAFLFNPRRSGTLDQFVMVAEEMFAVRLVERYDELVWSKHCGAIESKTGSYKSDLHYPILLILEPLHC